MAVGKKLEGASPRDLAVVFGILFDKSRLARGLSTSNVGVKASIIMAAQRPPAAAAPAPETAPLTPKTLVLTD
jgi:hypothetical protein